MTMREFVPMHYTAVMVVLGALAVGMLTVLWFLLTKDQNERKHKEELEQKKRMVIGWQLASEKEMRLPAYDLQVLLDSRNPAFDQIQALTQLLDTPEMQGAETEAKQQVLQQLRALREIPLEARRSMMAEDAIAQSRQARKFLMSDDETHQLG